jgi:type IV pilus assembly protein PilW
MQPGFSLIELMVAMTIGLLALGALLSLISPVNRSLNLRESLAEMNERARTAMAVMETDVQLAGFYGLGSRGADYAYLSGGNIAAAAAPAQLRQTAAPLATLNAAAQSCGDNFAIDLAVPIQGDDNRFALGANRRAACAARAGGARVGADTLTLRRASTPAVLPDANRLQILTHRLDSQQRWLLRDGTLPAGLLLQPGLIELHDLNVRSFYVANDSVGASRVPALRVKELTRVAGRVDFTDTEVMPGIEDMQVEFLTSSGYYAPESLPATSVVLAARLWLLARAADPETGYTDTNTYRYAGRAAALSVGERRYRRTLFTRTIALRNAHVD